MDHWVQWADSHSVASVSPWAAAFCIRSEVFLGERDEATIEVVARDLYQRERYGANGPLSRDPIVVGVNSGWNLIVESVAIERVRATDLIAPPRSSISVLSARTSSGLHEPPTGRRDVRGTDRAAHLSDEATPRKAPEKFLFLLTGNPHGAATPVRTARWPRICIRECDRYSKIQCNERCEK